MSENERKRARPSEFEDRLARDAMMDSLPYVDAVHEDYEQYALALIEEEMKNCEPLRLPALPPIKFRTSSMEQEYQRYGAANGKPEPITFQLDNAKPPPDNCADVETWRTAVQRARAAYEAERIRSVTVEIKKDGALSSLWKSFNASLDKDLANLSQALNQQKELIEQINLQRSQDQQKDGKQLQILTTKYQEALERRIHLQLAIRNLEEEMEHMHRKS